MHAYISITDAAECMRRQGQVVKGSRCGSGWVRASSGRTGLRVDTTGGAQDGVGCHGHDKRFAMSGETMLVIVTTGSPRRSGDRTETVRRSERS